MEYEVNCVIVFHSWFVQLFVRDQIDLERDVWYVYREEEEKESQSFILRTRLSRRQHTEESDENKQVLSYNNYYNNYFNMIYNVCEFHEYDDDKQHNVHRKQ